MAAVRIEKISKHFGNVRALDDISLGIDDGTFCVVLGPSGCGKSTLLNVVAGLEPPSSGSVYLDGKDITDLAPHKRDMAMVFQHYALYPHLSVFENMAFGLRVRGLKESEIKERIDTVSSILAIKDKLNVLPKHLSGGQRQRVATGRAMVREPALFLYDEPLSNLDARLRIELRGELIRLHKRFSKTTLYVTHDQVEAMVLGEVVVIMNDGRIQQVAPPQELYHNPKNLFVAEFVGIPPMNIIGGAVSISGTKLFLKRDSFCFELPGELLGTLEAYADKDIYCGIRPSYLKIGNGAVRGTVIYTETIGDDTFCHVALGEGTDLNIKLTGPQALRPGETVPVSFDRTRAFFFNKEGERLF